MKKRLGASLKQDAINQLQLPFNTRCKPNSNEKIETPLFQVDFLTHKIVNIE